ncbi:hypothetical protein [Chryseobacterium sp. Leaf201]|uniref:hypothetical protein n=1 Tax=Chryseobacterium sp. Leaf201 TaxID=1735672 RepID=UPI0009EBB5EF|nr:hypothetical protein [Chryseobacterium sp. Leaf201]
MSKKEISELKEYFKANKRPTQGQFEDLLDSYVHLNNESLNNLKKSEHTTYLQFPANYLVGNYVEFLGFQPDMAFASGYYEISIAYTRGNVASAATHLVAVSHANPDIWRECGIINRNNYVSAEDQRAFTIDVNGALRRFRIRAIKTLGVADPMSIVIKVRSISTNLSWDPMQNVGNDISTVPMQPMTDEWELLVGSAFSPATAKVALKADMQGNVGVGTRMPQSKLHVLSSFSTPDQQGSFSLGDNTSTNLRMGYNSQYAWIQSHSSSRLQINPLGNNVILNRDGGNVGIGTQNPDQKLTVKGKIHAEDVIVDMNVPADYVFEKYYDNHSSIREDYSMMNLSELEVFVKENKHLPEIPSGNQMTQDGVTLGDFQMKLLQKIEELTLYAISQHKEIEQLKSQIK